MTDADTPTPSAAEEAANATLDTLEDVLDELRERDADTPQWGSSKAC